MGNEIYNLTAIAYAKRKKKKTYRKMKKNFIEPTYIAGTMKQEFYLTREWKKLRWEVLHESDGKCQMCGASKATGAVLHVDHKYPRSKYPALELRKDNMQVLCADCNLGKGSKVWDSSKK